MTQPQHSFSVALSDESDTMRLMADLGLLLVTGDIVALSGDLGAGKTACARALIRYLADDPALEVPSPTFTLVQPYDLPPFRLLHADLYRINDFHELDELDIFDAADAVVVVEWPERAGHRLPSDRIDIDLHTDPAFGATHRIVTITGHGTGAARVERLEALRRFIAIAGLAGAERQRMSGDASTRSYARLVRGSLRAVLMNSPRRPDGPPVHDGKPYSAIAHLAEDVRPFVAMAVGLRDLGLSAPEVRHADLEDGFLILEDLGGGSFVEGDPPRPVSDRYAAAVDLLVYLHSESLPVTLPVSPHVTYRLPPYDLDAFLIEAGLFLDWYCPDRGITVTPDMRADFVALWTDALKSVLTGQATWVLRDFHSPNLIWLAERPGTARVGLLDFQDAAIGPAAYDVASLLQDARVDIPEDLEIRLLARYVAARRATPDFDPIAFSATYATMGAQRATKILGIFSRLNRRDNKPHYLRHQPRVWRYLARSLAHPALTPLAGWFAQHAAVPPEA